MSIYVVLCWDDIGAATFCLGSRGCESSVSWQRLVHQLAYVHWCRLIEQLLSMEKSCNTLKGEGVDRYGWCSVVDGGELSRAQLLKSCNPLLWARWCELEMLCLLFLSSYSFIILSITYHHSILGSNFLEYRRCLFTWATCAKILSPHRVLEQ